MEVLFIFYFFFSFFLNKFDFNGVTQNHRMELSDFVICVREGERFNTLYNFLCSPTWIFKCVRKH